MHRAEVGRAAVRRAIERSDITEPRPSGLFGLEHRCNEGWICGHGLLPTVSRNPMPHCVGGGTTPSAPPLFDSESYL
jgi:hypothetical protein